ncbi:hypothetical protein LCGC14_2374100, partial [marine sediment metagenome]
MRSDMISTQTLNSTKLYDIQEKVLDGQRLGYEDGIK